MTIDRAILRAAHRELKTDEECDLLLAKAEHLGLDPLAGHVYPNRRRYRDRKTDRWVETFSIEVKIDGFRAVAEGTGKYEGQEGPFWCGPDGAWRDVWLEREPPAAAKVGVWKAGARACTYRVARWDSFAADNRMWRSMPDVMLAKCAEAQALRAAFPVQLGGVYTPDEMAQAGNDEAPVAKPTPAKPRGLDDLGKKPEPEPEPEAALPPLEDEQLEEERTERWVDERGLVGQEGEIYSGPTELEAAFNRLPDKLKRMRGGKHKGEPVTACPSSYIDWLANKRRAELDDPDKRKFYDSILDNLSVGHLAKAIRAARKQDK